MWKIRTLEPAVNLDLKSLGHCFANQSTELHVSADTDGSGSSLNKKAALAHISPLTLHIFAQRTASGLYGLNMLNNVNLNLSIST